MLYHIALKKDWIDSKRSGEYKTESLASEGFIHCSPLEKIEESANKFFKGQTGLLILCIDESRVNSKIVWEDLFNANFKFPHIYGILNVDAVLQSIDFEPDRKGKFNLPAKLKV
jgi:uncharacterized protein (DUF952 family)